VGILTFFERVYHSGAAGIDITDAIAIDLKCQQVNLVELHIDRAYLSSSLVQNRSDELTVYCKAWQVRQGKGIQFFRGRQAPPNQDYQSF